MAGNLSRFLRLERPRNDASDGASPTLTPERFQDEPKRQLTRPPTDEAPGETRTNDFQSGLSLDTGEAPNAEPFVRCAYCEADNGKFASQCYNCGRWLDTPEQRAFNEKFWEQRLAQAQLDAQERQRGGPVTPLDPQSQRALGESIAQAVGEREEERLGGMRPSVGRQLLDAIPHPGARTTVAVFLVAFGLFSTYRWFNPHQPHAQWQWGLAVCVLTFLFVPRAAFPFWRRDW